MPLHTFDRLRIKGDRHSCLSPSFFIYLMFREETDKNVCPTAFHIRSHASQIHFVCMHDLIDSSRHKPRRFHQPQKTIPNANELPITQHPKKSALQRRQRHQGSVQIKKRRDPSVLLRYFLYFLSLLYFLCLLPHHIAPCAARFTLRTGPTLETKRQPSASTGNPRNKQNAAVIHVKTCAPTRTSPCKSAVVPPSKATGPRVNANSNPK